MNQLIEVLAQKNCLWLGCIAWIISLGYVNHMRNCSVFNSTKNVDMFIFVTTLYSLFMFPM
jgi:hypothetical protein